jgi:hypothetical protein
MNTSQRRGSLWVIAPSALAAVCGLLLFLLTHNVLCLIMLLGGLIACLLGCYAYTRKLC